MKDKKERVKNIIGLVDAYDVKPLTMSEFRDYMKNILLDYDYYLFDELIEI